MRVNIHSRPKVKYTLDWQILAKLTNRQRYYVETLYTEFNINRLRNTESTTRNSVTPYVKNDGYWRNFPEIRSRLKILAENYTEFRENPTKGPS